jgi:hypothetical protein
MDNDDLTQQVKDQLETLLLEAILSVLEKIRAQIMTLKNNPEEKF